jgi:hypothetical protein
MKPKEETEMKNTKSQNDESAANKNRPKSEEVQGRARGLKVPSSTTVPRDEATTVPRDETTTVPRDEA